MCGTHQFAMQNTRRWTNIYFMCAIIKKALYRVSFFFFFFFWGRGNNFYFLVHISQGIAIGSTRNIGGKFVTLLLKDSALFAYFN